MLTLAITLIIINALVLIGAVAASTFFVINHWEQCPNCKGYGKTKTTLGIFVVCSLCDGRKRIRVPNA